MPIAFSPGGVWGTEVLYAITGTELRSFEFDFSACPPQLINTETVGTGFDGDFYNDMTFGPDGALYISHQNSGGVMEDAILRVYSDCNANGIPDECDIDCGSATGLCDVAGCGQGQDTDGNGILDVCKAAVPAVSDWGLVVMSLLVLTAGTLVYARRCPVHA